MSFFLLYYNSADQLEKRLGVWYFCSFIASYMVALVLHRTIFCGITDLVWDL